MREVILSGLQFLRAIAVQSGVSFLVTLVDTVLASTSIIDWIVSLFEQMLVQGVHYASVDIGQIMQLVQLIISIISKLR